MTAASRTFADRKPVSRRLRPWLVGVAGVLLAAAVPNVASAQTLGYAPAPQAGPFSVDDEILMPAEREPAATEADEDAQLPDRLRRTVVSYPTDQPAGTIVIDTANTYLYYVLGGNRAIRYGVGVGREGFTWSGVQTITRKAEWPDWRPPAEMIARQPYLPRFMAGGPGNPLGARAMYLGSTAYRIHGTNDPSTIGKFVSSGCIRLTNEDVEDLFGRVGVGTRVVVLPKSASRPVEARSKPQQPSRHAMNISISSID
ncbi:lipoprotein-anchoring transpeptidase ErfK/SrfK [Rhodopseudomonas thermotolerans]|jgi:lipoprotein-anchoring transpeptidase ErfK/SrfK|uniref:Lipoprotein-anchoring transpeptidase ErfK/SrfK n=2 Tax=Rhodopseudomonas TaxID=1073 RepID=A0A336JRE7_9BRAD|nr:MULTISPECIES: L,D-transpeptidase [Rhodopseudomonas]RED30323.1 lipoprotein-anchoring transpeptidase ErfK/SrfK [Rhodopseudomonas pentothenatexigens]REF92537.1 lipoprotein-anchoring transpeptidase ErfK/SrfK [Rhodopseudomonas thermotolerans]SSW92192.1 lipoprotein-anchoring transpeptidase ErfK/SrfK [Rhodopseudomonas pentothenatexigens]